VLNPGPQALKPPLEQEAVFPDIVENSRNTCFFRGAKSCGEFRSSVSNGL
jgi:hypothetical protein